MNVRRARVLFPPLPAPSPAPFPDVTQNHDVTTGTRAASRALAQFDARVVDGVVNGTGHATRGASWLSGAIDRYLVDGLVNGLGSLVRACGGLVSRLQTGVIQNYVLAVFGGVIVLIAVMHFF